MISVHTFFTLVLMSFLLSAAWFGFAVYAVIVLTHYRTGIAGYQDNYCGKENLKTMLLLSNAFHFIIGVIGMCFACVIANERHSGGFLSCTSTAHVLISMISLWAAPTYYNMTADCMDFFKERFPHVLHLVEINAIIFFTGLAAIALGCFAFCCGCSFNECDVAPRIRAADQRAIDIRRAEMAAQVEQERIEQHNARRARELARADQDRYDAVQPAGVDQAWFDAGQVAIAAQAARSIAERAAALAEQAAQADRQPQLDPPAIAPPNQGIGNDVMPGISDSNV